MVSKLKITVLVPYPRNQAFVRRSGIAAKLRKQFGHGQDCPRETSHSRAALWGLGGTGYAKINLSRFNDY
jgi:hypothetical protein